MSALSQYLELYDAQQATIAAHAPAALNALRDAARGALDHAVLPRRGNEDYEATDIEALLAPDYGININRLPYQGNPSESFRCDVPNMSTCLRYLVNDIYRDDTATGLLPQGVIVTSMAQAAKQCPQLLDQHYGRVARLDNPVTALNTLLVQDGLFIYVPDGVVMDKPIQVVNIFNAATPVMATRRILVVMGRNASARLLVCDHTQRDGVAYLSNQVVEVIAGEGSMLDYYDLEESTPATTRLHAIYIDQQAHSNVLVDGITLLNGITRNNCHVEVNGEGATTQLMGMTIASGKQHVDNYTHISHNAPRCTSNEMYKYVLDDEAIGAFAGRILVKPGCPRVEAYQGNRNVCASPTARMYTKPQLEIYTDDVKCSHGAAVGQLDEEALFYMQQRGIPLKTARTMLMQAFVFDVVDAVRMEALRDRLHHLVEKRFNGTLARCGACAGCSTTEPTKQGQ